MGAFKKMHWIHKNRVFIAILFVNFAWVDSFRLDDSHRIEDAIKMKAGNNRWGLNLEHFEKEPVWMDLLNIPDNSNILGTDSQRSEINKLRSLSITNNLEILRNNQGGLHSRNGRERKSLGEQLNFLG